MSAAASFDLEKTYTLQSEDALVKWDEIAALLARIELIDTPLSHVREMVASREAQIWCIGDPIECVWVTKVENTRDHRYGLLWLGSGDLRIVAAVRNITEPWFRELGCKYVQIIGRRGWKRHFPDYEEQSVILTKPL